MAELIDPSGSEEADQAPKIIVDSDWKAEAQAEKERLSDQEEQSAGAAGAGKGLPEADFRGLLGALATQAMMYLGAFPDPDGRAYVSPEYARHYIDLLGVLEEKTKGNITEDESKELAGVLNELRVRFVQIVQGVAAAAATQEAGGTTPADSGDSPPIKLETS